jgi:hypothetical protein
MATVVLLLLQTMKVMNEERTGLGLRQTELFCADRISNPIATIWQIENLSSPTILSGIRIG